MKDCPRCHGSGEIGFNDSPINDPQCAQEATCNVCHGDGAVPDSVWLSNCCQWPEMSTRGGDDEFGDHSWTRCGACGEACEPVQYVEGTDEPLHYRHALGRIARHAREGDVAGQVNAIRAIARDALEAEQVKPQATTPHEDALSPEEWDDRLACIHCCGEGICNDGADPLGNCPVKPHRCHACGGSGDRERTERSSNG